MLQVSVEGAGHMGVLKIPPTWISSYSYGPDRHMEVPKPMVKAISQRLFHTEIRTLNLLRSKS